MVLLLLVVVVVVVARRGVGSGDCCCRCRSEAALRGGAGVVVGEKACGPVLVKWVGGGLAARRCVACRRRMREGLSIFFGAVCVCVCVCVLYVRRALESGKDGVWCGCCRFVERLGSVGVLKKKFNAVGSLGLAGLGTGSEFCRLWTALVVERTLSIE
jgi:hypothetical protein